MQGQRPDRRWQGYVQAVVIATLAAALKWSLDRSFGELPRFITFYPAVMICSMLGGVGPGILATLLGLLAADLLFIEPIGSLSVVRGVDAVGMLLFACFGVAMSFLSGRLRTAANAQARRGESLAEALAKEQANLRAVFDVVNVGMLVIDEDGAVKQVNNTRFPMGRQRRVDVRTATSRATWWAASTRWPIRPAADTRPIASPAPFATPSSRCCAPGSPSTTWRRRPPSRSTARKSACGWKSAPILWSWTASGTSSWP